MVQGLSGVTLTPRRMFRPEDEAPAVPAHPRARVDRHWCWPRLAGSSSSTTHEKIQTPYIWESFLQQGRRRDDSWRRGNKPNQHQTTIFNCLYDSFKLGRSSYRSRDWGLRVSSPTGDATVDTAGKEDPGWI